MLWSPALAASLALLPAVAAPPAPAPLRSYVQTLDVELASPAAAAACQVAVAPVFDGKAWAFSARWDDNNLNSLEMRKHMAKAGLRGTFYLGSPDPAGKFGESFAKALTADGCSVGGHSATHPHLPELAPNAIFREILACRVAREADTDQPINSFAFPYGQYQSPDDPTVLEAVTLSLRAAGYHHVVYNQFPRHNPHLAPNEFSTGNQVVPGDRVVDAAKFRDALAKILKFADAYRQTSTCIFLGVHPWQAGAEWDKLDAVFAELANRPDWWYCSQTDFAAYQRQVWQTRVAPAAAGSTCHVRLTRPDPADLGAAVPLTLLLTGGEVKAVKLAGQALPTRVEGDLVVVNVPAGRPVPRRIERLTAGPLTATAQPTDAGGFAGLRAALTLTADGSRAQVTLVNGTAARLTDLCLTLRLPPAFEQGLVRRELATVAAGETAALEVTLPPRRAGERWQEGRKYLVAELDFSGADDISRLFIEGEVE